MSKKGVGTEGGVWPYLNPLERVFVGGVSLELEGQLAVFLLVRSSNERHDDAVVERLLEALDEPVEVVPTKCTRAKRDALSSPNNFVGAELALAKRVRLVERFLQQTLVDQPCPEGQHGPVVRVLRPVPRLEQADDTVDHE